MTIEDVARAIKRELGSSGDAYASQCRVWISVNNGKHKAVKKSDALAYLKKLKSRTVK